MKKELIIVLLIVIGLMAVEAYHYFTTSKTAYVLIGEVYNKFDLKKELEKKLEFTKNARQKISDSLAFDLKLLAKKIDDDKAKNEQDVKLYNLKREEFVEKKRRLEEDNNTLTKQYDQEILTQLNQYVKDYGKENHYTYIHGNDGNGSLMYADESKNITEKVIEYINKKYKGEK